MVFRHIYQHTATSIRSVRHYSKGKKFLDVSIHDQSGIATVTLKRPPVNSINLEFLTELTNLYTELENNKSRGMILTSYSDKIFSAGLDLTEFYKPNLARLTKFGKLMQDSWLKLYQTPYPTIAVINGHALGGACAITIGCENRIMVDNFKIGLNEVQVGMPVPPSIVLAMQNTISKRQAELALTTGKLFTTKEALGIGLIDETASNKQEAMDKAMAFLERFETVKPKVRTTTKNYFRRLLSQGAKENDLEIFVSSVQQPLFQKNIGSYLANLRISKTG